MPQAKITGVILAGGKGSRMGGVDKGLFNVAGKPLYQHVLQRLAPQVDNIIINANRNIELYQQSGYPIITDQDHLFNGPLAGILSALTHSQNEWLVCCACDTPQLPLNLVEKLYQQRKESLMAYAHDGDKSHPTLLLIHRSMKPALAEFLARQERKLMLFLQQHNASVVYFTGQQADFCNLNTLDECHQWEQHYYDASKQ